MKQRFLLAFLRYRLHYKLWLLIILTNLHPHFIIIKPVLINYSLEETFNQSGKPAVHNIACFLFLSQTSACIYCVFAYVRKYFTVRIGGREEGKFSLALTSHLNASSKKHFHFITLKNLQKEV